MRGQQNIEEANFGLTKRRGSGSQSIVDRKNKKEAEEKAIKEQEIETLADMFIEELNAYNYKYDIELGYNIETNCENKGCEEEGICRCQKISNIFIKGDKRGIFEEIGINKPKTIRFPVDSLYEAMKDQYVLDTETNKITSLLELENVKEEQMLKALLGSMHVDIPEEEISIETDDDYYGETIYSVHIEEQDKEQTQHVHQAIKQFFTAKTTEDKQKMLLEHLKINPKIIDEHNWKIENIPLTFDDFIISQEEQDHELSFASIESISAVLTLEKNNHYKVLSGTKAIRETLASYERIFNRKVKEAKKYGSELPKREEYSKTLNDYPCLIGIPKNI